MNVKIDPEFRDLIPPASDEERRILESKLRAEGCREQLVGWGNDPDNAGGVTLIEGHTRQGICERLGIGYQVRPMQFTDRDAVMAWIEDNQLGRRNLTDDQRAAVAFRRSQRLSEVAKRDRASKAGVAGGSGRPKEENSLAPAVGAKLFGRGPRSVETAAKDAKVSKRKVQSVGSVAKKRPELVKKIADGEVTISQAKKLSTPAKEQPHPEIPTDADGTPLPDVKPLRDTFAARAAVAESLNAFTQLRGALNRMWDTPAAARIRPQRQRIEAHLDEARQMVRDYQPHAVCPDCRGKGEGCGRCGGQGWITKEAADRRAKADKARQGAA